MPAAGFKLTITADERSQTYALDRAATGTVIIKELRPSNPRPNPVILIQIFVIFSSLSPGKFQGIALNYVAITSSCILSSSTIILPFDTL